MKWNMAQYTSANIYLWAPAFIHYNALKQSSRPHVRTTHIPIVPFPKTMPRKKLMWLLCCLSCLATSKQVMIFHQLVGPGYSGEMSVHELQYHAVAAVTTPPLTQSYNARWWQASWRRAVPSVGCPLLCLTRFSACKGDVWSGCVGGGSLELCFPWWVRQIQV